MAHCRSGACGGDTSVRVRTADLGAGRSGSAQTSRRLAQSDDDRGSGCDSLSTRSLKGRETMRTEVLTDAEAVARKAATLIAAEARKAVAARGRFVMAVSGGHTPWVMLRALAE